MTRMNSFILLTVVIAITQKNTFVEILSSLSFCPDIFKQYKYPSIKSPCNCHRCAFLQKALYISSPLGSKKPKISSNHGMLCLHLLMASWVVFFCDEQIPFLRLFSVMGLVHSGITSQRQTQLLIISEKCSS